jgi:hypothetical protein
MEFDLFIVYVTNCLQLYMASNDIAVNNEWEWMWKGASMI